MPTKSIYDVRRDNLRQLVDSKYDGNRSAFARATGKPINLINLMLTPNTERRKPMGEKLARDLEAAERLPTGWLDVDRGKSSAVPVVGVPRTKLDKVNHSDIFPEMLVVGNAWLSKLAPYPEKIEIAHIGNKVIIFDPSNKTIEDDAQYVINDGGTLIAVKLTKLVNNNIGLHGLVMPKSKVDLRGRVIGRLSIEKV